MKVELFSVIFKLNPFGSDVAVAWIKSNPYSPQQERDPFSFGLILWSIYSPVSVSEKMDFL